MKNSLSRRTALALGAGAAALGIDSLVPRSLVRAANSDENNTGKQAENILVVIQLTGGNDGLNTVVPLGDPIYSKQRPELGVKKSDAIGLSSDIGLHPSLRGFHALVEDGAASIIQGVGYPQPNRSHFESMDIWHSCHRESQMRDAGWLGRYLESIEGSAGGDVPGLHLGGKQQPLALASRSVRVPSIKSLEEFKLRGQDKQALADLISRSAVPTGAAKNIPANNDLLGFVQSSSMSAVVASQRISDATNSSSHGDYPDNRLAEKLRTVAQLIGSGLSTRVYYVQLEGFDTHAKQAPAHAALLETWSAALSAFWRDIRDQGDAGRVCCMTFSEFGRRVRENASGGTDHGAAAPMFLVGEQLESTIIGEPPNLEDLDDGDVKHAIDFREVYAGVLADWLKVDPTVALGKQFQPLSLFS